MAVSHNSVNNIWRWFTFCLLSFQQSWTIEVMKTPLLLPDVHPSSDDIYICHRMKLDHLHEHYIVEFEPKASKNTAHHMLLYGCKQPGSENKAWNCGEMSSKADMPTAPVCQEGSKILYAWALDAPKLQLPKGVGFKVGGNTDIKYLVLQVHFSDVSKFKDGSTDNSGVILTHTINEMPKLAGVFLLVTGGQVPPHTTDYFEVSCKLTEDRDIHPFAYRTHTHSLGKVVSGYVIQNGEWKLLGKRNPQTPQMFYPVEDNSIVIKKGDTLASRCTMENTRDRTTYIGSTKEDEMCNFYLMYWVKKPMKLLDEPSCSSAGPPYYHWTQDMKNIPLDASTLPEGAETPVHSH